MQSISLKMLLPIFLTVSSELMNQSMSVTKILGYKMSFTLVIYTVVNQRRFRSVEKVAFTHTCTHTHTHT